MSSVKVKIVFSDTLHYQSNKERKCKITQSTAESPQVSKCLVPSKTAESSYNAKECCSNVSYTTEKYPSSSKSAELLSNLVTTVTRTLISRIELLEGCGFEFTGLEVMNLFDGSLICKMKMDGEADND